MLKSRQRRIKQLKSEIRQLKIEEKAALENLKESIAKLMRLHVEVALLDGPGMLRYERNESDMRKTNPIRVHQVLGDKLVRFSSHPPSEDAHETFNSLKESEEARKTMSDRLDMYFPENVWRDEGAFEGDEGKINRGLVGIAVHEMFAAMRFAYHGSNVFRLSEQLCAALTLTDIDENEKALVKLPYPAIYLKIPRGFVPLYCDEETGEVKWTTSVLLNEYVRRDHNDTKGIYVMLCGDNDRDAAAFFYNEGTTRKEFVARPMMHCNFEDTVGVNAAPDELNQAFCLVDNFLHWLDAAGKSDVTREPMRKKHKKSKKVRKHGWPTFWIVGKKVRLPQELFDVAKEAVRRGKRGPSGAEWKLRMQHVVRGHWKMQAYGPKHSLRKRLWVEPYMRGPEGAVAWSHLYEDKASDPS